ncbi:MAG: hypothetical protein JSW64_10235 [Candidatus Zixiibacteriota bacterium]|nr:MAG: hypothetical protein JSW64_10235 [candidate division Zixibacteria bacterium]
MRIIIILMANIIAAQTAAFGTGFIDIIVPPEHISTTSDHVYIVGRTDAPLVEVKVNNREAFEVAVDDSIFHAHIKFGYGLNEIMIIPIYGGMIRSNENSVSLDILSSPNISRKYSNLFIDYRFHNPEPVDACTGCHKHNNEEREVIESAESCLSCHRYINDRFKNHIPDDRTACVICHKIGTDLTQVKAGNYSDRNPCYMCHKDKIGEFTQDYIHGPVAGGSCTICHDPHGSSFEYNLLNSEDILCGSCHSVIDNNRDQKTKHRPFEYGDCSGCHDPHATNYKWVLVKNSQEVCMNCHDDERMKEFHDHPYNVKPKRKLEAPLKLTERGQLECLSCHAPHASDTEHLLRISQENTCTGCHKER